MKKYLIITIIILLCAHLLLAQEINQYVNGISAPLQILRIIAVSVGYYLVYLMGVTIPLSSLRLFNGFDGRYFLWISILFIGGMFITWLSFKIVGGHKISGALIAVPLLFGWHLFVNSRTAISDLMPKYVLLITVILTILTIPWFGQLFEIKKANTKLDDEEASIHYFLAKKANMPLIADTAETFQEESCLN